MTPRIIAAKLSCPATIYQMPERSSALVSFRQLRGLTTTLPITTVIFDVIAIVISTVIAAYCLSYYDDGYC